MSIGAGVVLFVIGAILRFALEIQVAWLDIALVGNILMGAGIVVFILGLIFTFRRRQSSSRTVIRPTDGNGTVRHTDRTDDTGI
ncbi:DUF6458 family protein [Specibacter sp. NPDC078692]|uniref:DUF6458 family protein n=1 Tax=Specibacter sp. NPDC078692 TaxID=3155818 RepID=UPI0034384E46